MNNPNKFINGYNGFVTKTIEIKKKIWTFIKRFFYPFYPFFIYLFVAFSLSYIKESTLIPYLKNNGFSNTDPIDYVVNTCVNLIIITWFSIWYFRKFRLNKEDRRNYGYKDLNKNNIVALSAYFIAFNIFIDCVIALTSIYSPKAPITSNSNFYNWNVLTIIIFSCLQTPICEELIARGISFNIARALDTPFIYANILQALIFSLLHDSISQKIYAFFFSLFLGYIYDKYGNLFLTIIMHIVFNLWGLFISPHIDLIPIWGLLVFIILFVLINIYIFAILLGKFKFNKNRKDTKKKIVEEILNEKFIRENIN